MLSFFLCIKIYVDRDAALDWYKIWISTSTFFLWLESLAGELLKCYYQDFNFNINSFLAIWKFSRRIIRVLLSRFLCFFFMLGSRISLSLSLMLPSKELCIEKFNTHTYLDKWNLFLLSSARVKSSFSIMLITVKHQNLQIGCNHCLLYYSIASTVLMHEDYIRYC